MDYKFLDKIVEQILSETDIDLENKKICFPFLPHNRCDTSTDIFIEIPQNIKVSLAKYTYKIYGLNNKEFFYVYKRYKNIIIDKILNNSYLDPTLLESTKQLPDTIFRMIQDDLFGRTLKIPRTNKPLCTGGYSEEYEEGGYVPYYGTYERSDFVVQLYLPSSKFPYNVNLKPKMSLAPLNDYLIKQYGLTDEECQRVWDEFRLTICKNPKLPTLNESKQDDYLKLITNRLLKDTKYDKQTDMVVDPIPIEGRAIRSSLNFTIYHQLLWDLRKYLNKIYGLTDEESDEVWGRYQRKIRVYNNNENRYYLIW